eukprot:CAMPEP_0169276490 /NCGR_PEP_ID=MMETSP1016-20121227/53048_1 /TAXON_ID=342587 /ORGANISM="Karlodinium micrum, Strain CCMP2283" /LENGTH=182 /DNA_ID=CAMNT_0009363645 /DNA_START=44 /DNA_END=592 /DNA_ORIENTATION=-
MVTKGSKSSKGKGKGKGSWVWMPAASPWKVASSFRSSKGKGKGKGKKKGGSSKKPFSELSDEKKEEIRARHEEKQQEQGRETIGDEYYFGELVQRGKSYGWVKPASFGKLPSEVQSKVKEMLKEKKKRVKENDSTNEVFKQNVLFLHMSDVKESVKVQPGDRVKFKVYVDNEGAGVYDVSVA